MPKLKVRKILVPVDFSEYSKEALAVAADVARDYGAQLLVLHVMAEPESSVPYEVYVDWGRVKSDIRADSERMLVGMMREVFGPGERKELESEPTTLIRWGEPGRGILDVAREEKADLIIMATHGRTGLSRVFMGSVTESVLRRAPCPTLVIRSRDSSRSSQ
ncbi:MAG: universal stress protein [Nitrospinota bacterium]